MSIPGLASNTLLLYADPKALRMRLMGPLFGGLSGLFNGATAIAGPMMAVYLHAKRLTSREFVASAAVVFQIFSTVQVLSLWRFGLYDREVITTGLLSLIPSLLAFVIGIGVRARLDNATFRLVISVLLALSAVSLLAQGLRGLGVLP